jgi:serine/threonine-protein kinase Chk2
MVSSGFAVALTVLTLITRGANAARKQGESLVDLATSDRGAFVPGIAKRNDAAFENQYQVLSKIGKGHFGDVYQVVEKNTNHQYAMKTIAPKKLSDLKRGVNDIYREVRVQDLVAPSGRTVGIKDMFEKENGEYVIMTDYSAGGPLFSKIAATGGLEDGWDTRATLRQVVDGVEYFHEHGVVHLDLNPKNFWCHSQEQCAIDGFADAQDHVAGFEAMLITRGTPEYMAPEVLRGWINRWMRTSAMDLKAVDVWALGVSFYQILAGRVPFKQFVVQRDGEQGALAFLKLLQKKNGGFENLYIPLPDSDADDLIRHMLDEDPAKRFTIQQVAKHKYFQPLAESSEP